MRQLRILPKIEVSDPLTPFMAWSEGRKRYEVYNGYAIKERLKEHGFWFDGSLRCWYTKDNVKAGKEKNIMNSSARKHGYSVNITK